LGKQNFSREKPPFFGGTPLCWGVSHEFFVGPPKIFPRGGEYSLIRAGQKTTERGGDHNGRNKFSHARRVGKKTSFLKRAPPREKKPPPFFFGGPLFFPPKKNGGGSGTTTQQSGGAKEGGTNNKGVLWPNTNNCGKKIAAGPTMGGATKRGGPHKEWRTRGQENTAAALLKDTGGAPGVHKNGACTTHPQKKKCGKTPPAKKKGVLFVSAPQKPAHFFWWLFVEQIYLHRAVLLNTHL